MYELCFQYFLFGVFSLMMYSFRCQKNLSKRIVDDDIIEWDIKITFEFFDRFGDISTESWEIGAFLIGKIRTFLSFFVITQNLYTFVFK